MGVDFPIHGLEFRISKKSTPWPNKAKKAFYLVQKTYYLRNLLKPITYFFRKKVVVLRKTS